MSTGRDYCHSSALGQLLAEHGGFFHPSLVFQHDEYGTSIYVSPDASPLPAGQTAVSCPHSLAITPQIARKHLLLLQLPVEILEGFSDHEAMVSYLVLHRIELEDLKRPHEAYVESLPKERDMRTPLWYNEEERELLKGTNIYGAVLDREKTWKDEWKALREKLGLMEVDSWRDLVMDGFTWEAFLWASTILSSRAFPSTLLFLPSETTSSGPITSSTATPILFPGVDALNHHYGQRIHWLTSHNALSIALDDPVQPGEQVWNTYGPKGNEELLLGYGFVIPDNPGDVVVLKLPGKGERYYLNRTGVLPDGLLEVLRDMVGLGEEDELDALEQLGGMLDAKLQGIVESAPTDEERDGVREDVRALCDEYRRGQIAVLEATLDKLEERQEALSLS